MLVFLLYVFFFSSRRRHTRCLSDWSSDVCSSDLILGFEVIAENARVGVRRADDRRVVEARDGRMVVDVRPAPRSEERRVGKECRSRWSADHEKKDDARRGVTTVAGRNDEESGGRG